MTALEAKQILEGKTEATDDQIAEANQIATTIGTVRRNQQAAKLPPYEPPWQAPIMYPNSGFLPVDFMDRKYIIDLNYDTYVYDINEYNKAHWSGGSTAEDGAVTGDAQAYRSWRQAFVDSGFIGPVPPPHARKVPCSLADYYAWWNDTFGNGFVDVTTTKAAAPFKWQLAPRVSDFDFDAAIQAKQALKDGKTGLPGSIAPSDKPA